MLLKEHKIRAESFMTYTGTRMIMNSSCQCKASHLYFPIDGRSFIPPDRVFGNVQLKFRAKSFIDNPDEYIKMDWEMYGDSKIGETALVQGETFYEFQWGEAKALTKRSVSFSNARIADVPTGVEINLTKVNDVRSLPVLHYGEQGQENIKITFTPNFSVSWLHSSLKNKIKELRRKISCRIWKCPEDGHDIGIYTC
ncbi:hypothetical protein PR048_009648 [Dryococelus australis]|uniref:Vitellogenin n=1 Tax=Dryococelus australis TaxID=614101 RepID=A0ABQ9I0H6_9NEOP|nr:hypothetical protein PR048_009648 [Dryococelus australis]